jgi:hypothetical protein
MNGNTPDEPNELDIETQFSSATPVIDIDDDSDDGIYDPVQSVILNLRDDAWRLRHDQGFTREQIADDLDVLIGRLENDIPQPVVQWSVEIMENYANAIHRMPYVRACLLDYANEAADRTAVAAVIAIWTQINSLNASAPNSDNPAPAEPDWKERADRYASEINNLRNVIQSACIGGMPAMAKRWGALFPDAGPLPDNSATSEAIPPMYLADGVTSNPEWLTYKHCVLNHAVDASRATEALQGDADRLDFMAHSPPRFLEMSAVGMWRVYEDKAPIEESAPDWRAMTPSYYKTPREAIDAANHDKTRILNSR